MNDYWLYALIVGIVIILALAFYAGRLLKQLSAQTKQQQQQAQARQQELNKHDKKVFDSVLLITRAMQQEQCEFDEGCWRLSVLMSSLKTISDIEGRFPAIYQLYTEIKELSILDARKSLTKQERMREDLQRMKALEKNNDSVKQELGKLHQFTTEQLESLT